jgi:hypothetical protein
VSYFPHVFVGFKVLECVSYDFVLVLVKFNVLFIVHHSITVQSNQRYLLLFSLLRMKGLCMFRALLAPHQVALHKWHLVYCVRVMSVGLIRFGVSFQLQFHFWKCEEFAGIQSGEYGGRVMTAILCLARNCWVRMEV